MTEKPDQYSEKSAPPEKKALPKKKSGRAARGFGSLLCVLSGTAFVGLIGVGVLWGVLQTQPVSLNLAKGLIERAAGQAGAQVSFQNPRLILAGEKRDELQVTADKITLKGKKGETLIFSQPFVSIGKSALLFGRLRPYFLSVDTVSADIPHPEGADDFFADLFVSDPNAEAVSLTKLYDQYLQSGFLAHIKTVDIAKIETRIYQKKPEDPFLSLKNGALQFSRKNNISDLLLYGSVRHPYVRSAHDFGGKLHYDRFGRGASVGFFLADAKPDLQKTGADFQGAISVKGGATLTDDLKPEYAFLDLTGTGGNFSPDPELQGLRVQSLKLKGAYYKEKDQANFDFNLDGDRIAGLSVRGTADHLLSENPKNFTMNADIKKFDYGEIFEKPVTFSDLLLQGSLDLKEQTRLNLKRFEVKANNKPITGKLQLTSGKKIKADANFTLPALNRDELLSLWPIALPGSARYWVEHNLQTIQTEPADFVLAYDANQAEPIQKLAASIPYQDGKFTFIEQMSPIENASGNISLDGNRFFSTVTEGRIEQKILVKDATFQIPDINAEIPMGETDLMLSGDVLTLLTVLDQPPLAAITKNGIPLESVTGNFTGAVTLSLPLISDLRFEDVKIDAGIQTEKAGLDVLNGEYKLRNADMKLSVTHEGISAVGATEVNEAPLKQATWEQKFSETANPSMIIRVRDMISSVDLAKLGYDFTDYFQGSADADFYLAMKDGKISALNTVADLRKADIFFPLSDWRAPEGSPKTLSFKGKTEGENFKLQDFSLIGDMIDVKIKEIDFKGDQLSFVQGATLSLQDFMKNVKADITRTGKGGYHAEVRGDYVRLKPFLEDKTPPSDKLEPFPDFSGDIRFQEALLGEATHLPKFIVRFGRYFEDPYRVYGVGRFKNSDYFKYTILKTAPYQQDFAFSARNGGAFLSAFGAYQNLLYGWVNVEGKSQAATDGQTPAIVSGNITVKKALLLRAPVLARILALASFTGIGDFISRSGMSLDRTEFDFVKNGDQVDITDGRLKSSAVGLTYQGKYNMATGAINLSGAVTPFYDINSLLGNVPLIGNVFVSEKGEGVISASYSVSGDSQKPDVRVNPFSAVAPGILRQIFDYLYF